MPRLPTSKLALALLLARAAAAPNDAAVGERPLMAPPEEWITQLMHLNKKEPRAAAVKAYLAQLAMMLTGATFHCGSTPGFTGDFAPLTSCLDIFRRGQGPHRTWGVSMAGLGRMASIVDMVEDVAKRGLNGSYAETGVWRGGMTILATAAFQLYGMPTRPVYLCDSFEGLPAPRRGSTWSKYEWVYQRDKLLSIGERSVLANFERYGVPHEQVVPVKGFFVKSMPPLREKLLARGERLSILRLDGDMYDSTVDVLYNLYDLLLPGGYVIIDDFMWSGRVPFGARIAVMEFRKLHGIEDDAHAVRNIDGTGAWFYKAREVTLRRDLYLESMRAKNQSMLGPPNTATRGKAFAELTRQWRQSWSEKERKAADAVDRLSDPSRAQQAGV